jgi:hypothetical protein
MALAFLQIKPSKGKLYDPMTRRLIFITLSIPVALLLLFWIAAGGVESGYTQLSTLQQFGSFLKGPALMTLVIGGIYLFDRVESPDEDFFERVKEDPKALAILLAAILISFALVAKPGLAQDVPRTEVADTAETYVGVTEHPKNSNKGEVVERCLSHVGLGPGYPYCAACASLWLDEAGVGGPIGESGDFRGTQIRSALSAHFIHARLFVKAKEVRLGHVTIPPGSVGIHIRGNSRSGHAWVVWGDTEEGGGNWRGRCGYTIEANTTPSADAPVEDQRDGGGIWGPKKRCINPGAYFRLVGFAVPLK